MSGLSARPRCVLASVSGREGRNARRPRLNLLDRPEAAGHRLMGQMEGVDRFGAAIMIDASRRQAIAAASAPDLAELMAAFVVAADPEPARLGVRAPDRVTAG